MQRRKVLLPEPELPIMAMTSPSLAESEMPFSTSSSTEALVQVLDDQCGCSVPHILGPNLIGYARSGLALFPVGMQLWQVWPGRQAKNVG